MRLVLFDIDGTLIWRAGARSVGYPRFEYAVRTVFGVEPSVPGCPHFGGWVDRSIVREFLKGTGVTETEFAGKWPAVAPALVAHARREEAGGARVYAPIADALALATLLSRTPGITLAVMTGNVELMGRWKLEHTGLSHLFPFGVYSDGVEDRIALARTAPDIARAYTGSTFRPHEVTVIGDTVYDVRCGKAIGADTIAVVAREVTDGIHGGDQVIESIRAERPTVFVRSLMDRQVLSYFGIPQDNGGEAPVRA